MLPFPTSGKLIKKEVKISPFSAPCPSRQDQHSQFMFSSHQQVHSEKSTTHLRKVKDAEFPIFQTYKEEKHRINIKLQLHFCKQRDWQRNWLRDSI